MDIGLIVLYRHLAESQNQKDFDEFRWLDRRERDPEPALCPVDRFSNLPFAVRGQIQDEQQQNAEAEQVPGHPFDLVGIKIHDNRNYDRPDYIPHNLLDREVRSVLSTCLCSIYTDQTDNQKQE